jgi:hypothetical protein
MNGCGMYFHFGIEDWLQRSFLLYFDPEFGRQIVPRPRGRSVYLIIQSSEEN